MASDRRSGKLTKNSIHDMIAAVKIILLTASQVTANSLNEYGILVSASCFDKQKKGVIYSCKLYR